MGHIKRDCRKRQRDNQGKSDGASFALAATINTKDNANQNELLWIFDSGASQHMINQDVLTEARTIDKVIRCANGEFMEAKQVGKVHLTINGISLT